MRKHFSLPILLFCCVAATAQDAPLVNTTGSRYAKLSGTGLASVHWTKGFWAERFQVCKDSMIPNMWRIFQDTGLSHAYRNFEIAAGKENGVHEGPPFYDGDFYKWFEAVAAVYAATKDKQLDVLMDNIIATIAASQRADGYIHTPVIIEERAGRSTKAFEDRLNFETYNLGHLMTAACVHYRATGKKNLLQVAIKATDYLYRFYKQASPELARNAICPSHYMGVVEMYRTTKDPRYLELAINLINIRGLMVNGTDDNQDRVPFRQQTHAMGHAVRANYLYAGVADVYAEIGDDSLRNCLDSIWNDVVHRKMYVTGACGALYDGVSPDGTSYEPSEVQKTHQSYGRAFQLPNVTAHNETCANIGNLIWNWRMLQLSGDAQYADIMELALYNSILSGISLNGKNFFYTNPLSVNNDFPYVMRWARHREPYISCFCCPPNVVRTIAEVSDYAYSISQEGLWVNLYGSNTLLAQLKNGAALQLEQQTDYPWNGSIRLRFTQTPGSAFTLFLRVPGWCKGATVRVNGKQEQGLLPAGKYVALQHAWYKDDLVELELPMPVQLVQANPLVEEVRNQVAVQRGPLVYCLESVDLPAQHRLFNVSIPAHVQLTPQPLNIAGSTVLALEGNVNYTNDHDWQNRLYQPITAVSNETIPVKLVPYYAWDNRAHAEMSVWLPLAR